MNFLYILLQNPITETLAKETGNSIRDISLVNPILALLLIVLISLILGLGYVIYKLSKKVNDQNDKLYAEAKADLEVVLAFEKKIDSYLERNKYIENDIKEIKSTCGDLKLLFEISLKNNKNV